MLLFCLKISFYCVLQKYLFFNLIIWQNFISINTEVLLWGVPSWLFHSSWVMSSSVCLLICPLDFPKLTFSSQILYTPTLYLTPLSLRFPISGPHFPIVLHPYTWRNSIDIFELAQLTEQELGRLRLEILSAPQNHTTFDVWNSQTSWRGKLASYLAQLLSWLLQDIDPTKQPS